MVSTLKLVERQLAMVDIRRRLEERVPQPGRYITYEGIAFGPCLLISRECGSGGSLMAQLAGDRLGWNVFDATIVDEIARSAHVHQRLVQSVDEHVHSNWEQTLRDLFSDDLSDEGYLRHLQEVLMTLGHHGNVVIVGRGAKYLLPSQCAVRVRLVAPLETRAKRVAERQKLPMEVAKSKVREIDKERAAFARKVFQKDIGSALYHDLIINTSKFDEGQASDLVLDAVKQKLGVDSLPKTMAASPLSQKINSSPGAPVDRAI
ncbi:MAG TPA: cytidylate kinase-like family protein [Verrucomicrobiae bacterium]|nr:cytidylate kinase-like family protein [Verrucomicrobiae bacterium]